MALNSSGQISLGGSTTGESVALELSLSPTGQISLDDAAVRTLLGKPTQYSEISLLDAYGKSNVPESLVGFDGLNAPVTLSATTINIAGSKNVDIACSGNKFVVVCQTGSGSACTPKFTYSTNEGATWSALTTMGSGYNRGRDDHAVCIAVNTKNNVFVYANYGLSSSGSTFPIVIATSDPGGQTWNTPFEIEVPPIGVGASNYGVINAICFCPLNNRFIAMGVSDVGTPIYTYSDTSGLGTGWSTPSPITSSPVKLRPLSIATNTSGDKMVAIARLTVAGPAAYVYGGQPYSSYSLDGGITWSAWRITSASAAAQAWYKVVYNAVTSRFVALCASNAGVMRFSTIAAADLVGVGADPNLSPWSAWSQLSSGNATVNYGSGAAINSDGRIVALANSFGSPPNYLPYWSTSTTQTTSADWSVPNQFTQSPTLWFDDIVCNSRGRFIAVGFSGSASTIQYCSSIIPPPPATLVMGITSRFNNQFVYKGYGNGAVQFPETVPQMGSLSQTTFTSPGTGGTATFIVFGLYSLSAYGDPYTTYLVCPTNGDTNQGNMPIWININGLNYYFSFGGNTNWRRITAPFDVLNYGIGSSVTIGAIYGTQPPGPIY